MRLRPLAAPALILSLALTLVLSLGTASAQFTGDPFFEHTDALRHAHALTMIEVRLAAIDALLAAGELSAEAEDLIEDVGETLPLLAGSLADQDQGLLAELEEALEELEETFSAGTEDGAVNAAPADERIPEATARTRELVERARQILLPAVLPAERTFQAAVAARLLLAEDGVAEAYEDAVEEDLWEFPLGWAALQRVKELWTEVEPDADSDLAADVREALEELDRLFPHAQPPAALTGDPEDAEEPAHSIVSLLERITDAQLHPDRELGRLAGLTFELAQRGCEEYAGQRVEMGFELLLGAREYYEYLADTASLLAQDAHERVEATFDSIAGDEPEPVEATCPALLEALDALRLPFGG